MFLRHKKNNTSLFSLIILFKVNQFHPLGYRKQKIKCLKSFWKKKFGSPKLGSMGLNQAQNEVFRHLLEFGSYVFLEIAYNDSLRQCQTSSRGKIYEKKFGP